MRRTAAWTCLHSNIETLLYDLHPNPVLSAREMQRRLKAMQTRLEIFL